MPAHTKGDNDEKVLLAIIMRHTNCRWHDAEKRVYEKRFSSYTKGRRSDGENDAREKGDRSIMLGFAIFARYTITYKVVP